MPDGLLHNQFSDWVGPQVLPTLVTSLPLCFIFYADTIFAQYVSKVMLLPLWYRDLLSRCSDLAEMQIPIRCVVVVNKYYEKDPNFQFCPTDFFLFISFFFIYINIKFQKTSKLVFISISSCPTDYTHTLRCKCLIPASLIRIHLFVCKLASSRRAIVRFLRKNWHFKLVNYLQDGFRGMKFVAK